MSKSLYYGDTAFCEKWPTSTSKSSSGRGAVLYGSNKKNENFKFLVTQKKILAIAAGYNNKGLPRARHAKTMVLSTSVAKVL